MSGEDPFRALVNGLSTSADPFLVLGGPLYESLPEDLFQRSRCLLKLIKTCTRTVSFTLSGDARTLNIFSPLPVCVW